MPGSGSIELETDFEILANQAFGDIKNDQPLILIILRELLRLRKKLGILLSCERMTWFRRISYLQFSPEEQITQHRLAASLIGERISNIIRVIIELREAIEKNNDIKNILKKLSNTLSETGQYFSADQEAIKLFRSVESNLDLLENARSVFTDSSKKVASEKLGEITNQFYMSLSTPDIKYPPVGRYDKLLIRLWRDLDAIWRWTYHKKIINLVEIGCGTGRVEDSFEYWRGNEKESQVEWRKNAWEKVTKKLGINPHSLSVRKDLAVQYFGIDINTTNLQSFVHWIGDKKMNFAAGVNSIELYNWNGAEDTKPELIYPENTKRFHKPPMGDYVLVPNVMHEITYTDLPRFLSELDQVLKPGGMIIFIEVQSLQNIEDDYIIWKHQEFAEVLTYIGFVVFTISSRSGSGIPVTFCYAVRKEDVYFERKKRKKQIDEIKEICFQTYQLKAYRLLKDIKDLSDKRNIYGLRRTEAFRHFHALQSFANVHRQILKK